MVPTIHDVAKLAKTSIYSVSVVLNQKHTGNVSEKTRNKILNAATKLNYIPNSSARGLKLQKSQIIAIAMPAYGGSIFFDPYFHESVFTFERELKQHDYSMLLFTFDLEKDEKRFLDTVLQTYRVDGAIVMAPPIKDKRFIINLEKKKMPIVMISSYPGIRKLNVIDVDNVKSAVNATVHLIGLGKRKIAFITGPLEFANSNERFLGYKKALENNGIPVIPELITTGDFSIDSGYNAVRELLDKGIIPDGIVASNDLMAIGAMNVIKEKKLVIPDDVAVVGFNNTLFSQNYDPPLTTVNVSATAIAAKAVDVLARLLKGEKPKEKKIILESELIIRKSTVKG
jgi:LacI family transcriptional regulator